MKQFEDAATFGTSSALKPLELLRLKTKLTCFNEVIPVYLGFIEKVIMEGENFLREETFPHGKENMRTEALDDLDRTANEYTAKYNSGVGASGATNTFSTSPGH